MSAEHPTISVGVFAHDEEATLEACVGSILDQRVDGTLLEIVIVSSGSRDATDAIAQRLARRDSRVRLLPEPRRDGKARAINRYLAHAARADRIALVSADVVLAEGALELLLAPFADPTVGMTGGRPMPQNERRGVGRLVHLLWDLHDAVARRSPKLGEAVVLRAPIAPIPEDTSADEAALEADIVQRRHLRLVYCAQAIVHNRGPETLADWLEHRRRIARAHAEIEAIGYRPATRDPISVLRGALAHAVQKPDHAPLLAAAALIEGWAWIAGSIDARALARSPRGTWKPIESAKRPVARVASPPP
jgi:cellulose synthase/poly-beta-1,6-N-acetylglucosamine synthase-like glycosyltransferase